MMHFSFSITIFVCFLMILYVVQCENSLENLVEGKQQPEQQQQKKNEPEKDLGMMTLSKQFEDEKGFSSLFKSLMKLVSKNGLDASVRGLFDGKKTGMVAAVSMIIGAITMLAFYESPISPLPVPPLPDPPVGRFPPEHPVWPPPAGKYRGGADKPVAGGRYPYPKRSGGVPYPPMSPMGPPFTMANNFIPPYQVHRSDGMRSNPIMNQNHIHPLPSYSDASIRQPLRNYLYNSNSHLLNAILNDNLKQMNHNQKRIVPIELLKKNNHTATPIS